MLRSSLLSADCNSIFLLRFSHENLPNLSFLNRFPSMFYSHFPLSACTHFFTDTCYLFTYFWQMHTHVHRCCTCSIVSYVWFLISFFLFFFLVRCFGSFFYLTGFLFLEFHRFPIVFGINLNKSQTVFPLVGPNRHLFKKKKKKKRVCNAWSLQYGALALRNFKVTWLLRIVQKGASMWQCCAVDRWLMSAAYRCTT